MRSAHTTSCSIAAARKVSAATSSTLCPRFFKSAASFAVLVVLPVPFTPTMSSTFGFDASGRSVQPSVGRTLMISSRATFTIESAVGLSVLSCSVLRMRCVKPSPRSARMSDSSSSSQSTGLPVNLFQMFLRKPKAMVEAVISNQ